MPGTRRLQEDQLPLATAFEVEVRPDTNRIQKKNENPFHDVSFASAFAFAFAFKQKMIKNLSFAARLVLPLNNKSFKGYQVSNQSTYKYV